MRHWQRAPLQQASFLVHGACMLAVAVEPRAWVWMLAIVAGNHLVLTAAVFFPRAVLLGPNVNRLPAAARARGEVCLTFDDGPDPALTPRVLELLERYGAKASFFCIGEKAAVHPALVQDIARRGHSVENHTYRHPVLFACFGPQRMGREVDRTQEVLERLTGDSPRFFRAPAGFRSPLLHPVLSRRRLHYVSWTRRGFDAREAHADRVFARLARGLAAGDVLLLHDSSAVVLPVLERLLEELSRRELRCVSLRSVF